MMSGRLLAFINISPLSLLHLFHHCLRSLVIGVSGHQWFAYSFLGILRDPSLFHELMARLSCSLEDSFCQSRLSCLDHLFHALCHRSKQCTCELVACFGAVVDGLHLHRSGSNIESSQSPQVETITAFCFIDLCSPITWAGSYLSIRVLRGPVMPA